MKLERPLVVKESARGPSGRSRGRAFVRSLETLTDVELVAAVLDARAAPREALDHAARVLARAGGLGALTRLAPLGLARRAELPLRHATALLAALELGKRSLAARYAEERPRIVSLEAVLEWARPRLTFLEVEEVWLLTLNGTNRLQGEHRIARGGLHGCALTPRDVLRPALRDGASAIVLVHNHPSGDPEPSPEDVLMTRALRAAAGLVGLPLLDHVIVASRGAVSLLDAGLLGPPDG
jgi:DNA repair protein RadC